jgi:RNA-directed DNA polymerase
MSSTPICRNTSTRFPRGELLRSVARRISDRHLLRLIKLWLRVPAEERDGGGGRRMSGGKSNKQGTPQGGVIDPLLANLYMNRFLKYWRIRGCNKIFRAHLINYADDFVILGRGFASEALAWTRAVMTRLGLSINEAKTSVKDARTEGFDFLGYTFGPKFHPRNGQRYPGASPSRKSLKRIKTKDGDLLVPGNKGSWLHVQRRLNASWLAGRLTSAMAPEPRPIGLSTGMSPTGSDASSPSGTRNMDWERAPSPGARSSGHAGCSNSLHVPRPAP